MNNIVKKNIFYQSSPSFIFVLITFLAGLYSTTSYACKKLMGVDTNVQFNNGTVQTINFRVHRNNTNISCEYAIGFNKGDSNDGSYNRYIEKSPVQILMQIYDNTQTQILQTIPDVSPPSNMITGTMEANVGGQDNYHQFVGVLGDVPYTSNQGNYDNNFTMEFYTRPIGSSAPFTLEDTVKVKFKYIVRTRLDLSLVPAGAPFDLEDTTETASFGTLVQGDEVLIDLIIGNNTGYKYSLSSVNGGYLKKVGSAASATTQISYSLYVSPTVYTAGSTLNPGDYPFSIPFINPPSGSETRFPFKFTVTGDPAGKVTGSYEDVIYVNLTAQ